MSRLPSTTQKTLSNDEPHESVYSSHLPTAIKCPAQSTDKEDASDEGENPFHMSPDTDFFLLRDRQKEKHRLEREAKKTMRVYEKMTYSSKIAAKCTNIRRQLQMEDYEEDQALQAEARRLRHLQDSAAWKITVTKEQCLEAVVISPITNLRENNKKGASRWGSG